MIREATLSDAPSLAGLMQTLGYPTSDEAMRQRLKRIVNHPDYLTLVFERHHSPVGMIGMAFSNAYHSDDPHVRVIAFVVERESQGEGIGRKLMMEAEEWARRKGAATLILNSGNREERKLAHHIYETLGFRGTSIGFYKNI